MSFCLSTAAILRCPTLTQLQHILVSIPVVLEVIFSVVLICFKWGSGRQHLWLSLEGWVYFALVALDLVAHLVPAARSDLLVFEAIDITLAAASFLPIFFYALFLFLYMRRGVVPSLPRKIRNPLKYTLLLFIPTLIAGNFLSSFFGISRRHIVRPNGTQQLAIGFKSPNDRSLFMFLTSAMLALLTAYQALAFCLALYRVMRTLIDQRRIEDAHTDEAHLANGIGYVTIGLKLGAIETVLGFVPAGFTCVLVRRVLRLASRAFLIVGIIKGIDSEEDFEHLDEELRGRSVGYRRSKMRSFISGRRFSAFRQIEEPNMEENEPTSAALSRRVTVRREKGHAPTLDVRFSVLDVPLPDSVTMRGPDETSVYTTTNWASTTTAPNSASWTNATSQITPVSAANDEKVYYQQEPVAPPQPAYYSSRPDSRAGIQRQSSGDRRDSNGSSIAAVRALASQFPGLPPRVSPRTRSGLTTANNHKQDEMPSRESSMNSRKQGSLTPRDSMKRRKPVPAPAADKPSTQAPSQTRRNEKERLAELEAALALSRRPSHEEEPTAYDSAVGHRQQSMESGHVRVSGWVRDSGQSTVTSDSNYTYRQSNNSQQHQRHSPSASNDDMHWLPQDIHNVPSYEERSFDLRDANALARIKSIGRVQGMKTPTPTHAAFPPRGSVSLVKILPQNDGSETAGSTPDIESYLAVGHRARVTFRADSGVLGQSDPRLVAL